MEGCFEAIARKECLTYFPAFLLSSTDVSGWMCKWSSFTSAALNDQLQPLTLSNQGGPLLYTSPGWSPVPRFWLVLPEKSQCYTASPLRLHLFLSEILVHSFIQVFNDHLLHCKNMLSLPLQTGQSWGIYWLLFCPITPNVVFHTQ